MPSESDVLAAFCRALVDDVVPASEREVVLASIGIQPSDLIEREGRLPHDVACRLWSKLTDDHPDPLFGFRFAERVGVASIGITGYLAMASSSSLEAIERVIQYHRLIKGDARVSVQVTANEVCVIDSPSRNSVPWPRHLALAVISAYLTFARRWSTVDIVPIALRFQHAESPSAPALRQALGCPVEFDHVDNEIVLPREPLDAPFHTHDPELGAYLERLADRMLAELPVRDDFVATARRALVEVLPSGDVTLRRVARRLGLGTRTLQRRLQELGLSFQTLLDEVRREASERLLGDPQLNVTEVAFLLGYSDASGLRRARSRWTGSLPRDRKAQ